MYSENSSIKKISELALQHYQNGNLKKAEILFKKILEKIPNHFFSIFLLGTLSAQIKKFPIAKKLLKHAIKINPYYKEAHNNLGNVLHELGEYKEAKNSYQKAIEIDQNFIDANFNFGNVLEKLNRNAEALLYYQKSIKLNPNYIKAYYNLGNVYEGLGELKKSISFYRKVIQINPKYTMAYNGLGMLYRGMGDVKNAILNFQKAIQIEPDNLTSHWLSMNTFPIIYQNIEEIDHYRNRFEKNINKINQLLDKNKNYTKDEIINALKSSTNFYLIYQSRNDLYLQQNYARLIERLTKKVYPQYNTSIKKKVKLKHIRVGFVSSNLVFHSITKTYKNWILKLDKNLFNTNVYYIGNQFDKMTNQIKKVANNFFNHTNIDQLISKIYKDKLDILIYFDIGMHPKMQILGSLRLAPIQCNTWGHPVTSGLKNIDYFFSSELIEKYNSQKYYSEKLIILPGLGTDYDNPNLSNIKKSIISKKKNKVIFLSYHSLFKMLPQNDHIFIDILKKVPNCQFWFFKSKNELVTSAFKTRLLKLSKKCGVSFNKYFYFLPRCKYNEFLGFIEVSDIILDSLSFSGFNTAIEAVSLNKPVVTLPGLLMKKKLAYSVLKKINLKETIATSKEEYVEIAIKLAKDINFRSLIINKIIKNKNNLFGDEKPIKFIEEFFKINTTSKI